MEQRELVDELAVAHGGGDRDHEQSLIALLINFNPRAVEHAVRAQIHLDAASLSWSKSQPEMCLHHLQVAAELYEIAEPTHIVAVGMAHCQSGLAYAHLVQERDILARQHFKNAVRQYHDLEMSDEEANCQSQLDDLEARLIVQARDEYELGASLTQSDRSTARIHLDRAFKQFQMLDAVRECADKDFLLAGRERAASEYESARLLYIRAQGAYATLQLKEGVANCDRWLAFTELALMRSDIARSIAQRALIAYDELQMEEQVANCQVLVGHTYLPERPELAIERFEEARKTYTTLERHASLAATHESLALAEVYRTRSIAAGRSHYLMALDAEKRGGGEVTAGVHVGLAQVAFAAGDRDEAEFHFRAACDGYSRRRLIPELCAAEIALAKVLHSRGGATAALELAVPAALAIDAYRFRLSAAEDRFGWTAEVGRFYEDALSIAVESRDARLIAELVESARGNGSPSRTEYATGVGDDSIASPTSIDIRPPPAIVLPWGVALGRAIEAAEERVGSFRARGHAVLEI